MTFGQSIKTVFKNLTNFKGRARRSEFWWFYLFISLVSIPFAFVIYIPIFIWAASVGSTIAPNTTITDEQGAGLIVALLATAGLAMLFSLVVLFFTIAVWVRRLHDAGYSGHLLWLTLIGLGIVPLIFAILEGNRGPNQYGPDPKAVEGGSWPLQQTSPTYAQPPAYQPPPSAPNDPFAAPPRQD